MSPSFTNLHFISKTKKCHLGNMFLNNSRYFFGRWGNVGLLGTRTFKVTIPTTPLLASQPHPLLVWVDGGCHLGQNMSRSLCPTTDSLEEIIEKQRFFGLSLTRCLLDSLICIIFQKQKSAILEISFGRIRASLLAAGVIWDTWALVPLRSLILFSIATPPRAPPTKVIHFCNQGGKFNIPSNFH